MAYLPKWIPSINYARGTIACTAHISNDISPGVVQLYHGFRNANVNYLTDSDSYDPMTGSVPLKSSLCRISKPSDFSFHEGCGPGFVSTICSKTAGENENIPLKDGYGLLKLSFARNGT